MAYNQRQPSTLTPMWPHPPYMSPELSLVKVLIECRQLKAILTCWMARLRWQNFQRQELYLFDSPVPAWTLPPQASNASFVRRALQ